MNRAAAERKSHWEKVYETRSPARLGWYRPKLETSLAWIEELALAPEAPIIDIGGGVSTLVDDLLDAGHEMIALLDISEKALEQVKARLGSQAQLVMWLGGDVTSVSLPKHRFDLWHDRAVFHFLMLPAEQERYRQQLLRAVKPGGHAIISTFAPEAPAKCSGLPVMRYDHAALQQTLGEPFQLERYSRELHVTPGGVEQMYQFCQFRLAD